MPMANLPKITPHLWFEKEAKEAAAFLLFGVPQFQNHARIDNPRRADPKRRLRYRLLRIGGSAFHGHQRRANVQVQ
jgi:predicted 3-demethylubiquinone-9 3-methyltransferase (glyoxalase superfamily)